MILCGNNCAYILKITYVVVECIIYNDSVDKYCFITSINATDATVTVKYFIDKTIVENISWIARRIASILDKVQQQSGTSHNAQSTAPLPSSLTSQ